MFTGIIESLGIVHKLEKEGGNLHLHIRSDISTELRIDQSVSHNGVCLTVIAIEEDIHVVTAVQETLQKSALGQLQEGDPINLERAMKIGDRLDGHMVQGHVDTTARCTAIKEYDGSWVFSFEYDSSPDLLTVEKGSITVDGVSLTVVNSKDNRFDVAIIPYTYQQTRFRTYDVGQVVNLEFDVIGKYIAKYMAR
ncbi:MAG: riboflavin synthase [Flavobacteriaceae bacterium]|nr:riboflavin synthase [Flavobacteriaceae bacterium]